MKKIIYSTLLIFIFTFTFVNLSFASDYTNKAIEAVKSYNIMTGTDKGFENEKNITRGEMAAILCRMTDQSEYSIQKNDGDTIYSDVPATHWARKYIKMATYLGLLVGSGDGTFRPDDYVTYNEVITMICRLIGSNFDIEKEGQWPTNYQKYALENSMNYSLDVNFADYATREEVATTIYNSFPITKWYGGKKAELTFERYIQIFQSRQKQSDNKILINTVYDKETYCGSNSYINIKSENPNVNITSYNLIINVNDKIDIKSYKPNSNEVLVTLNNDIIGHKIVSLTVGDAVDNFELITIEYDVLPLSSSYVNSEPIQIYCEDNSSTIKKNTDRSYVIKSNINNVIITKLEVYAIDLNTGKILINETKTYNKSGLRYTFNNNYSGKINLTFVAHNSNNESKSFTDIYTVTGTNSSSYLNTSSSPTNNYSQKTLIQKTVTLYPYKTDSSLVTNAYYHELGDEKYCVVETKPIGTTDKPWDITIEFYGEGYVKLGVVEKTIKENENGYFKANVSNQAYYYTIK